jgi:hypothetical protein
MKHLLVQGTLIWQALQEHGPSDFDELWEILQSSEVKGYITADDLEGLYTRLATDRGPELAFALIRQVQNVLTVCPDQQILDAAIASPKRLDWPKEDLSDLPVLTVSSFLERFALYQLYQSDQEVVHPATWYRRWRDSGFEPLFLVPIVLTLALQSDFILEQGEKQAPQSEHQLLFESDAGDRSTYTTVRSDVVEAKLEQLDPSRPLSEESPSLEETILTGRSVGGGLHFVALPSVDGVLDQEARSFSLLRKLLVVDPRIALQMIRQTESKALPDASPVSPTVAIAPSPPAEQGRSLDTPGKNGGRSTAGDTPTPIQSDNDDEQNGKAPTDPLPELQPQTDETISPLGMDTADTFSVRGGQGFLGGLLDTVFVSTDRAMPTPVVSTHDGSVSSTLDNVPLIPDDLPQIQEVVDSENPPEDLGSPSESGTDTGEAAPLDGTDADSLGANVSESNTSGGESADASLLTSASLFVVGQTPSVANQLSLVEDAPNVTNQSQTDSLTGASPQLVTTNASSLTVEQNPSVASPPSLVGDTPDTTDHSQTDSLTGIATQVPLVSQNATIDELPVASGEPQTPTDNAAVLVSSVTNDTSPPLPSLPDAPMIGVRFVTTEWMNSGLSITEIDNSNSPVGGAIAPVGHGNLLGQSQGNLPM